MSLLSLNQVTVEKMFNLMDTSRTGMVTYAQFQRFLNAPAPKTDLITHKEVPNSDVVLGEPLDSFEWQQ